LLVGGSASALPLTAGAVELGAQAQDPILTVAARGRVPSARPGRISRSVPRFRAPLVHNRPVVRTHRFVRRGTRTVIIGGGWGLPYYPYYDDFYPDYYSDGYSDAIAYCISRFRSYDIRTQTYLGYDGRRHPCP
jgi:hypothetical protein